MTGEDDLLRRSMAAAPEAWLDRVVTERVLAAAQLERAPRENSANMAQRARSPSQASPREHPTLPALLCLWLGRLVPADARALLWRDGDQL